ncbi:MAG: ATPase, T2SS/T4P/T4SS family, partial [Halodesulfurarchaeum sp.]
MADRPACRRTAIEAIDLGVDRLVVERSGVEHHYDRDAVGLLAAASSFAARIADRDRRLAERARENPTEAAREAADRAGLIGDVAAETGFDEVGDAACLEAFDRQPAIAASVVDPVPPPAGALREARVVASGATVRIYDRPERSPRYQLEPLIATLEDEALGTLWQARERLLSTESTAEADHRRAVESVAGDGTPVDTLTRLLKKHTSGYGILEDLFSDEALSEVFVNAPARHNPLSVRVDGERMETNVRLAEQGTERLAAAIRTESGRAFSRAAPTIDAELPGIGSVDSVRVAGVREPASEGFAFALRAEGTDQWRLSDLIANGTIAPEPAALLSIGMERGGAILIAGPRGAGKTTMAAALLWELPVGSRLLAIEDTPELPVAALQSAGRDVQRLEAAAESDASVDPVTALRTALRFGNGALAVGEVRGEEA